MERSLEDARLFLTLTPQCVIIALDWTEVPIAV